MGPHGTEKFLEGKGQPREWENIFSIPTSDRGLIFQIYKELKKLDIKSPNKTIEKQFTNLNRILNRRISNGRDTLKEIFKILSHKGNAN